MTKTTKNDARGIHRCGCAACHREPEGAVAREHQAINRLVACTDERRRRLVVGFLAQQYGRGGIALLARITVACTDERRRRLVVGFLAQQYGRGGIALLARITGLDRNTIARGRRELDQGDLALSDRVRRPGAGRKRVEVNSPES